MDYTKVLLPYIIARNLELADSSPRTNYDLYRETADLYYLLGLDHCALHFHLAASPKCESSRNYLSMMSRRGNTDFPKTTLISDDSVRGRYCGNIILTHSSSYFFPSLLENIANIHKNSLSCVERILVVDHGLTELEVAYLNKLLRVRVVQRIGKLTFGDWRFPSTYFYLRENQDKALLAIDAGCRINQDLEPVFNQIKRDGYLWIELERVGERPYGTALSNWVSKVGTDTFGLDRFGPECQEPSIMATAFGLYGSSGEELLSTYLQYQSEYTLRPHPDNIDTRHEQSLLSAFLFSIRDNLVVTPMETYCANMCGFGDKDKAHITLHATKVELGRDLRYLLSVEK